jgi:hypothetical protein
MGLIHPYLKRKNIHRNLYGEYGRYSQQILYANLYIAFLYGITYRHGERFKWQI